MIADTISNRQDARQKHRLDKPDRFWLFLCPIARTGTRSRSHWSECSCLIRFISKKKSTVFSSRRPDSHSSPRVACCRCRAAPLQRPERSARSWTGTCTAIFKIIFENSNLLLHIQAAELRQWKWSPQCYRQAGKRPTRPSQNHDCPSQTNSPEILIVLAERLDEKITIMAISLGHPQACTSPKRMYVKM